jgi:hypothetical protein
VILVENIFVNNLNKVKLNIENYNEEAIDLLNIDTKEARNFLKNNNLNITTKEDMLRFYSDTGIYLLHEIKTKDNKITLYFDISGMRVIEDVKEKLNITPLNRVLETYLKDKDKYLLHKYTNINIKLPYIHHIHVVSTVEEIKKIDNKIYVTIDNKDMLVYEIDRDLRLNNNVILMNNKKGNIKQTLKVEYFNKNYTLYNDGSLYEDDKLYAKDVKSLFKINYNHVIIIYNNYEVEDLIFNHIMSKHDFNNTRKYKKIIAKENLIMFLKFDNNLSIMKYNENIINETDIKCIDYQNISDIYEKDNHIYLVHKSLEEKYS